MKTIIKFIHHSGKKRQTSVEKTPTFAELKSIALKIWGESIANCQFGYTDDEDDLITISDQDDWNVCIEEFSSKQDEKKNPKIVIKILEEEDNFESLGQSQSEIQQTSSIHLQVEEEQATIEEPHPTETQPEVEKDQQLLEDQMLSEALQMSLENVPDQLDEWKMVTAIQSTLNNM